MSEKKLPPTKHRLLKARKEGQLGISQDVCKVIKLAVIAELAFASETAWRKVLGQVFDASLSAAGRTGQPALAGAWSAFTDALGLLIGIPVLAAVLAYAVTLAQTQFNVAPEALTKGFDKLNLAQNLKQLMSSQKLMPVLIGPFLIVAVGWVCYGTLRAQIPDLSSLYRLTPGQGWAVAMQTLQQVERNCLKVLLVWIVFDIGLQKVLQKRQLRMDHDEVKRERKDTQGDAKAKGARRMMGLELMAEGPALPPPSVIAINPEHIAVALAYQPGVLDVPMVVAKGADHDATWLRDHARRERIPVIRYVGLARQLYATGRIGQAVPQQQLRAVALLFHAVNELHEQHAPLQGETYAVDEVLGAQMLGGAVEA